jgi:hypothetical protein
VRATGLKRATPAHLAERVSAHHHPGVAYALANPGQGADWSAHRLRPFDQGATFACTAHAYPSAIWTAFAIQNMPMPWIASPRELYACAGMLERGPSYGSPLAPLKDEGRYLTDIERAASTFGLRPMFCDKTPDGRVSDIWSMADVAQCHPIPEPTNACEADVPSLLISGTHVLSAPYSAPPNTGTAARTVAAALDNGIPWWAGIYASETFMHLAPGQVMGVPNENEPGGWHAVWGDGYRLVNGRIQLRVVSSWGPGWADGGTCWADEDFLNSAEDVRLVMPRLVLTSGVTR